MSLIQCYVKQVSNLTTHPPTDFTLGNYIISGVLLLQVSLFYNLTLEFSVYIQDVGLIS